MNRREFIVGLGGAAAWPMVARAQQIDRTRRVGALLAYQEGDELAQARIVAFRRGLQQLGWVEGRNIQIEYRVTGVDSDRIQRNANDLVGWAPDVLLATPAQAAMSLQKLTGDIPIVFANVPDPIGVGLVKSLARPGGNITGFTSFEVNISGKWLELLKDIAPGVTRIAAIYSPQNPVWQDRLRLIESVAQSAGVKVTAIPLYSSGEIESSLGNFATAPHGGVILLPSIFMAANREIIIATTARHRLPAIYPSRFYATGGGLFSYGINSDEQFQSAAIYVDRILKGENPAALPVQAPTKFELVINLKTAKALGLEITPTLLARADEVIE
jgi:putative ABC transport system substrate-binding protein